jgi:signal transduction histidine kinase
MFAAAFIIMITTGILSFLVFVILYHLGFYKNEILKPFTVPLVVILVSLVIGTLLSYIIGRKVLKPVNELISAMQVVAKGDFSVRVKIDRNRTELDELIRNFNIMAEELGGIEIFRQDFINNFSHEFKTPIVSIRGFAKQLQNDDLPAEKRKEFTEIIVSEAERLTNMSANILLLTKFENQQYITDQTEFELDEQLRNCIILLEKQWSKKNIEIIIDLEPIKFFSNAEILSHLWINLVDNAIKYTNDNGHITIICRENEDNIQFKISDDGNGMDESTQKHIFDKFYQGDRSRTIQGNGLGLSIAKRIAELCEGEISVESKLGCGTTFTVILPKAQR